IERQRHVLQRHVVRYPHLDQRIGVADQIGAVRQRPDLEFIVESLGLGRLVGRWSASTALDQKCRGCKDDDTATEGKAGVHAVFPLTGYSSDYLKAASRNLGPTTDNLSTAFAEALRILQVFAQVKRYLLDCPCNARTSCGPTSTCPPPEGAWASRL